jgi:hypothetical protein
MKFSTKSQGYKRDSPEYSEEESSTSQAKHQNKPRQYKKDSFVPSIASKADVRDALERLGNALKQVPTAVHKILKARSTATLYVGNIECNATEDDLHESLQECLGCRIAVEKITTPRVNGKSMYGFIEFSWAQAAPVEVSDICTMYSGRMEVNSPLIYCRELRDKM